MAAACNFTLNEQGLLAGLMAQVPGLEAKPIEAVENACASGGQAVLSRSTRCRSASATPASPSATRRCATPKGKMDGKLVGKVLGYFSHPDERAGKVFVFPHIFAEVMELLHEGTWRTASGTSPRSPSRSTQNAKYNPYAQMRNVQCTLDEGDDRSRASTATSSRACRSRRIDCSQITDGYAALILATEDGLARLGVQAQDCVEIAGWGQATDPLQTAGRDVLRPRAPTAR